MITVRQATMEDCVFMASRLRPEDVAEIKAAGGSTPLVALLEGFHYSDPETLKVGLYRDEPFAICGVVPMDDLTGAVWALGTTDLAKHRIAFLRRSKGIVEGLHQKYPVLTNCVDARNTLHIEWLRWLGFTFIAKHPYWGAEKRPFYEFVRMHRV